MVSINISIENKVDLDITGETIKSDVDMNNNKIVEFQPEDDTDGADKKYVGKQDNLRVLNTDITRTYQCLFTLRVLDIVKIGGTHYFGNIIIDFVSIVRKEYVDPSTSKHYESVRSELDSKVDSTN